MANVMCISQSLLLFYYYCTLDQIKATFSFKCNPKDLKILECNWLFDSKLFRIEQLLERVK